MEGVKNCPYGILMESFRMAPHHHFVLLNYSRATLSHAWWHGLGLGFPAWRGIQGGVFSMLPQSLGDVHSRKLTGKPKQGPIKTTVPLKGNYCGWRKSCTTYIIGIFYDLTMHPRTPFLTSTTVLSEAVQDFRHWNGGFQCQC